MPEKFLKYANISELPLHFKPAREIRRMIDSREISSAEVEGHLRARIKEIDSKLGAYLRLSSDERKESPGSFWDGIPVAVKDNIMIRGQIATAGSKILENYTAIYDSTVARKLSAGGAVVIGKTNLDEFAMGSSTENSAFQKTSNPWDTSRVPGGSSGGSAVAVAAGMAYMSLGSDTGGSVRQPAALCGICGLKPTYGLVSRYGLIAFASSLDQIGPFTRDAEDMAYALSAIAGHDPKDSTSNTRVPDDYPAIAKTGIDMSSVRIGLPDEYFGAGIEAGVLKKVEEAVEIFRRAGAKIVRVSLPHTRYAIPVYYLIATAEASSNLARYDGVRYGVRTQETELKTMYMRTRDVGFGPEVKRRIILGTYALSSGYYDAYYKTSQKARTMISSDFENAFESVDFILTPTAPTTAFKFGEKVNDPLTMYLSDIFTISVNLASIPGLSIPCGLSDGMPVGLQILGPRFGEGKMIALASKFQALTDFHLTFPAI